MLDWVGMVYQKRGSAPTNTIKLTFDYDTLDQLRSKAAERKIDITRCAYELVQEALGGRQAPANRSPITALPEPEDRVSAMLARINQSPRGNA